MKFHIESMDEPEVNVSSLIDMVFLLLSYFLVTASLITPEADLGIRLPGMLAQPQQVDLPDEQIIEVKTEGHIVLNNREFDSPASQKLPDLVATLGRYKLACEAAQNKPLITITADNTARHQRVIDVMNACAAAGIEGVTFSASGEE